MVNDHSVGRPESSKGSYNHGRFLLESRVRQVSRAFARTGSESKRWSKSCLFFSYLFSADLFRNVFDGTLMVAESGFNIDMKISCFLIDFISTLQCCKNQPRFNFDVVD